MSGSPLTLFFVTLASLVSEIFFFKHGKKTAGFRRGFPALIVESSVTQKTSDSFAASMPVYMGKNVTEPSAAGSATGMSVRSGDICADRFVSRLDNAALLLATQLPATINPSTQALEQTYGLAGQMRA